MSFQSHSRANSSDTTASSTSSSYQLILDHILSYPGSYEIPLRTMYTLNSAPRSPAGNSAATSPSTATSSPVVPQLPSSDNMTSHAHNFTQNLLAQISQLPNQPASLPPSFIISFVRKCFPVDLCKVDFPQGLTGLDYLKDLETRRRREVAAAMRRLDIDRDALGSDLDDLSSRYPGVAQWVRSIEEKERKIETLYTQLYVGLRRWILINEMMLLPFNKHNCIAMLNTLYPPVVSTQPTSKLGPAILKKQRDGFFNYIRSVEKQGPRVLTNLMAQGKAPGDENGWVAVTRTIGMYLHLASSNIIECNAIVDVENVSPQKPREPRGSRQSRKADSGVSIKSFSERPSTQPSPAPEPFSPTEPLSPTRPLSPSEMMQRPKTPSSMSVTSTKPGTALEKLARGLKTIGRTRTNVTEIVPPDGRTTTSSSLLPQKVKSLRKMRSMGALDGKGGGNRSHATAAAGMGRRPSDIPAFDVQLMREQRVRYDDAMASHE